MADRAILLQLLESYHVATLPILKVREVIKMGRTGDMMTREYWSLAANEFKFSTKTNEPDVERATTIQEKHREEISKRLLSITHSFLLADGLLDEFRVIAPMDISTLKTPQDRIEWVEKALVWARVTSPLFRQYLEATETRDGVQLGMKIMKDPNKQEQGGMQ